jgi:hypothetical protein
VQHLSLYQKISCAVPIRIKKIEPLMEEAVNK